MKDLLTRLSAALSHNEKTMQGAAVPLIGERQLYGQDGEKFGPGEEHLGWSYSVSDMKIFRKGVKWNEERLRPIHKALIECVHQLRAYKCEDGPCQCGDCAALSALEAALREGGS